MHLEPIINSVRVALIGHGAIATDDPAVEAAVSHLIEALDPTLRLAAMEIAQQAAVEIGAQLPDRKVEVVLAGGDLELRVTDGAAEKAAPIDEEFDARITLRLPPTLKRLVEDSATIDGESVNAWVVDALSRRAKRSNQHGKRVTENFDL